LNYELPGYTLKEIIYTNARTRIQRAVRNEDNCAVIIKAFASIFPSPRQRQSFLLSYDLLEKFAHPNISKAIACLERDGLPFIVLEDTESIDLRQYAQQFAEQQLPIETLLTIAIQLADALSVIHQAEVIHKDLHPGNILINAKTGLVQINDFGLASLLSKEQTTLVPPEQLEGVLAYISPEQTGRMNRSVDYRSDFYTLGVTLYELLSGQQPFKADDALGLVYAHIAKAHKPLATWRSDIPPILSRLIDKLLNKVAEQRYQSALGLKKDLEKCLLMFKTQYAMVEFPLGKDDISSHFQIPQKLYGREREVKMMLDCFERASTGHAELLTVSGYSGVGKSALVHEVHQSIAGRRGLFVSGKFDQFQRSTPYSALKQALKTWLLYALSQGETDLQSLRTKINESLGDNARVMNDFMPEFIPLLGELSEVSRLEAQENLVRFNLVFQKFIQLISQGRPFVLFIDDLQWADSGTLNLLPMLLEGARDRILVIAAYRENEVDKSHPAMQTISLIRQRNNRRVTSLVLAPLSLKDIAVLLKDSLHRSEKELQSLAELVQRKTDGNPFFVNEFLKTLYHEGLLSFDLSLHRWIWEVKTINEKGITDNVVELILEKMQKLPKETQALMRLAACVGSRFDLEMLAVIQPFSIEEITKRLWPAITEGLILQDGGEWTLGVDASLFDIAKSNAMTANIALSHSGRLLEHAVSPHCKFLHDRMLEAAYHSLSGDKRQTIHLQIGRLLHAGMLKTMAEPDQQVPSTMLFDVVEQLNRAAALITEKDECIQLASLNLHAAELSMLAGVWDVAKTYAKNGMQFLADDAWETRYTLSYALHIVRIECEYLTTQIDLGNQLSDIVLGHARTEFEKANVCRLQLIHNLRQQLPWAIERGLQGLRYCGLTIPILQQIDHEWADQEAQALAETFKNLELSKALQSVKNTESELLQLECLLLVRLSGYSQVAGFPALFRYSNYRAMNVLLNHGAGKQTVTILGSYSIFLAKQKLFKEAEFFSQSAVNLAQQHSDSNELPLFYNGIGSMQWFYTSPFSEAIKYQQKSHELGYETGEVFGGIFAGFSNSIINYFVMGLPLEKLSLRLEQLQAIMHKYQIKISAASYYVYLLEGLRASDWNNKKRPNPFEKSNFPPSEWTLIQSYILKPFIEHLQIQWFFWSDQLELAWQAVKLAESSLELMSGFITPLEHRFLAALLACQKYPLVTEKEHVELCAYIDCSMEELDTLTKLCPENFAHKLLLLQAEKNRAMQADMSIVLSLYDQAIKSTKDGGYIQYQAFAYERCAEYWLTHGFDTAAKPYVQKAVYAYQQWGCALKCSLLKQKYAGLLVGEPMLLSNEEASSGSNLTSVGRTDKLSGKSFDSVMRALQYMSSELNLRKLMLKSLRLVLEITKAETVALVMNTRHGKMVEAQIRGNNTIEKSINLGDCTHVPAAVVNYVFQSGTAFNLAQEEDITAQDKYVIQTDPYIQSCQPKAMLCMPIVSGDKTMGVLYLDCCANKHNFTDYHQGIIDMLISQSTISFQNARLFGKSERLNKALENKVVSRTQALEATKFDLQTANEELASFSYSVSHDLRAPLRSIKGFSEILLEDYTENFDQSGTKLLSRIIDSANKMTELINGLLELSRVQNAEIDLKPINLTKLAQLIANSLNEEKIRQNKSAKQVLFKCAELVVVPGDERMFDSVMENLLNNAWKYSSKVEQAEVEFGVMRLDGKTVYFVKDNGAGFDMKHASNLFTTFKRLHLEHEFPGTGVGLDTVKRIINKHSGKIWAEAEVGKGATFFFTLWTDDV
jgi:predicted ATPase/signal transduction histidine kinase